MGTGLGGGAKGLGGLGEELAVGEDMGVGEWVTSTSACTVIAEFTRFLKC